jgi:uncharacterized membrane protein YdbT with pleckstrin-like domain
MGYVDKNLLPGETVIYRAHLHPIIFALPAFLAIVGVLLVAVALTSTTLVALAVAGVLVVVAAVIVALPRYIRLKSSEFAITEKRVLVKTGVVRRHTLELLLSKVETIGVEQGVLGRMLNYGTITVVGTGGTKEPFTGISHPLEFRRQVQSHATA